ncbi:RNA-binding protein [Streptomyces xanthophaeus]
MPSFVHRITKYDPADRDERGHYNGPEDTTCDHGPVEAAYLAAIAAFAGATGIERLEIREPAVSGPVNFGLEPTIEGDGLAGLFPAGPDGYHDGAEVSLPVALELVRAMLRDNGAWCRLEAGDAFTVHVGWDQYVFVGSEGPCEDAVARTRELGLFAEPLSASPYAPDFDEPGEQRPADEEFWELVRESVTVRRAVLLEEGYVHNATRWHRVTEDSLGAVRTRLAPRAQLHVWPDLSTDVAAVLADLPEEGLVELVWEAQDGTITSTEADADEYGELAALVAGARAASALSLYAEERLPLFTAVLPDADGVLRARWRTDPTPSDLEWSRRRGPAVSAAGE